ncbi:mTERF domain-containing protein, mitochondrial [Marchantia polymorpha subsp. ruderalis]|uniref:Transcription termination factor MTERF4, chloroplastic n=2 Tax=Marchantia polymorpha TaxID=3197 RepID=A0A176WQW9_MARPO|nr:hypothetical protein AXG93_2782s1120 [Marchantia polymorpha subsp. ruderalis]PTQ30896.1 hypothetical protein MARPO_0118s0031 [Marchantia polymorpha]BBM99629.1 hypothetical protein Mp_1g22560 [Marchantia polymorpha subsp. ruderalis]|eukprot:PTQ30896.1 hypothetical protein MARPO_0118s0031 [Marchantia polymorpha]
MTTLSRLSTVSQLPGNCLRSLRTFKSRSVMRSPFCGAAQISSLQVAKFNLFERLSIESVPLFHGPPTLTSTSTVSARCTQNAGVRSVLENVTPVHAALQTKSGILPARLFSPDLVSNCSIFIRKASTRSKSRAEAIARHSVAQPSNLGNDEPEQYENELVARDHVLRYLQSEGIDVTELEDVGLPPSVAVMKERVTFLRKIGLTTKDINGYPLMVGCSVKKNLVPVLSYLEKLNVEARFLPDFIRKYPMVLNSSVVMDMEPVVDFLLGIGIAKEALGRVLTRYPDILGFKIEGTMSTSVAYLVSLGVNMREVGPMVTEYPEILGMRVGNNIKPKVDYLLSLGIPKQVMSKILEVKPFILGFDLHDRMKPCIRDLLQLGVKEENVARVIIQYADVLGLDVKQRLDSKMGWLTKHAGVKREDIGQIIEKLPQILAINIKLAQTRVDFLKESGFTVEEIGSMVAKCPQILAISIEESLRPNFDFFIVDMKRPPSELVEYPSYFTYSLEKRIRPRYIQIEQRDIKCSLPWFLNCSDAKFEERLQVDFVERPDDAETEDFFIMGGRMKIKGEDMKEALDSDDDFAESS